MLLDSGEDLAVVSKLLGHSDLGTTSDVYAHLTLRMSRHVPDRVEQLLAIG
jgi:site-specific recombinase XerD